MYPILLITFNRPIHTKQVLSQIISHQPEEVYVFQDGARENNSEDILKCQQVREVVRELTEGTGISLHTCISDKNLGCGAGPMTAINWFFNNVEEGIVMEDDCLPNPDFFQYCSELLEKYRNNERVMYISSTLYDDKWICESSYDFSHYMITGAWASWSRAWKGFDLDLINLNAKQFRRHCRKILYSPVEADWWYFKTLEIQRDKSKKSYWDYQMQIHLFRNNGLTIHPQKNLVSNIGFDEAGTHTLGNDGHGNLPSFSILPLTHPSTISVDTQRDYICFAKTHSQGQIKDLINRMYNTMLFNQGLLHKSLMLYKKLKYGK